MLNPSRRAAPLACALLAYALPLVFHAQPAAAQRPNLVVLVVAEQFRADYLDLYEPEFSSRGLGRLLTQGAVFRRCRYDHLTTLAAPGATILAAGAYPELNGIVGNRWYDRGKEQLVGAVEESLSYSAQGDPNELDISPDQLMGSTFADELRLATEGRARVVAVSDSPAPAVLLAGRRPLGCYWMNRAGNFTTSSYYSPSVPEWVGRFNQEHPPLRLLGSPWMALSAGASAPPLRILGSPEQRDLESFLLLYRASPFAIDDTFAFATQAVEAEGLGQGSHTDLLIVNLSATARLGLETGAYSPLMRDLLLRLDRSLGDFLDSLDESIGLDNVAVVFTATHGVPPLPSHARELGLKAGRVSGEDVVEAMNTALSERFGPRASVAKYVYPFVYLNDEIRALPESERRRRIAVAGEAAAQLEGVAGYYAPDQSSTPSATLSRLRRSWYAPRSGDFMLIYEPYYVEDYSRGRGTTSGSYYRYDTDVPLIFLGRRFKAGRFDQDVEATSVAPTIASVLDVAAPSLATGTVLSEALAPSPQPTLTEMDIIGPPEPK